MINMETPDGDEIEAALARVDSKQLDVSTFDVDARRRLGAALVWHDRVETLVRLQEEAIRERSLLVAELTKPSGPISRYALAPVFDRTQQALSNWVRSALAALKD